MNKIQWEKFTDKIIAARDVCNLNEYWVIPAYQMELIKMKISIQMVNFGGVGKVRIYGLNLHFCK